MRLPFDGEATKRAVVTVGHQGAGGRQIYNFGCRFRIYQPARLPENGSMFLLPVCGEQHWGRCLTLPFTLRPFCRFPVPCTVTYSAGPFQGQGTV